MTEGQSRLQGGMLETLTPPYVPVVPPPPPGVPIRTPHVFVQPVWEYKRLSMDEPPREGELNALGAEGWELIAMIPSGPGISLYFKRLVR